MRRRWHWPLLALLNDVDEEDIMAAWLGWLVVGFLCLCLPALIIGSDKHDNVAIGVGSLPFWMLIAYSVPLALGVIAVGVWLLAPLVRVLIPRRVTDPLPDIRNYYHIDE